MNPLQTPTDSEPASRAGLGTEQLIAMIVQYYWTIYDDAMNAFRLSQQDKQVRVAEESGDGAKNKHSIRTENRPGTPTFLAKALEALKAIRQLLGLDAPRRKHAAGERDESSPAGPISKEDLCNMADEQLLNIVAQQFETDSGSDATSPGALEEAQEPPLVHDVHPAESTDGQVAPAPGVADGPDGGGPITKADAVAATPARHEPTGESPLSDLPARPQAESAANQQQASTPTDCEPQPLRTQQCLRVDPIDPHEIRGLRAVTGNTPVPSGPHHEYAVPGTRSKWKAARQNRKRHDHGYTVPGPHAK